jgi:AAA domain
MTDIDAIYLETEHRPWQRNPFIAALPEIISDDVFAEHVISFPEYDPSIRHLPNHDRLAALCDCENLFIPFKHHLNFYQRITRLIRVGYQNRNPLQDLNQERQHATLDSFNSPLRYGVAQHKSKTTLGFALTGVSGVGKSTALEETFRFYPQVIVHREYDGKAINRRQLIWLILECPEDGSLKSLCINFFLLVDDRMGTDYATKYGKETFSVSRMVLHFAEIAAKVGLGVLVIDEIQALKAKNSQGAEVMLNFFTRLTNIIGVPIVLVGTPKAEDILNRELHQIRRNSGQGEMKWGPLPRDEQWNSYVESLWEYQYLQQAQSLTTEFTEVLHRVSSGIVGFATKIFVIAQEHAINLQTEQLTPGLLETVAKTDFISAMERLQKLYRIENSGSVKQVIPVVAELKASKKSTTSRKTKTQELDSGSSFRPPQNPIGEARMLKLAKQAASAKSSVCDALVSGSFTKDTREFLH